MFKLPWTVLFVVVLLAENCWAANSNVEEWLKLLQSDRAINRIGAGKEILQTEVKPGRVLSQANNLLLGYLENGDIPDAEAVIYTELLAYSSDQNHRRTLNLASKSKDRKISKAARKSLKRFNELAEVREFSNKLEQAYQPISFAVELYSKMLQSDVEYTREEAIQELHASRIIQRDKKADNVFGYSIVNINNKSLMNMLNSDSNRERKIAAQTIYYLVAREKQLYDRIAELAKERLTEYRSFQSGTTNTGARPDLDELAWLIKSLASSGDDKYLELFDQALALNVSKLTFHTSLAKKLVGEFSKWRSALEQANSFEGVSRKAFHLYILDAPYLSIKDCALHYFIDNRLKTDDKVISLSHEEFSIFYPYVRRNAREVRPAARMLQIMAATGNANYLEVMEAAEKAPSRHLNAHAEKNIGVLKKIYRKKHGISFIENMKRKVTGKETYSETNEQ